jgi:hypothetical protein
LKARRAQNLADPSGAFIPGSLLSRISGPAQEEIIHEQEGLRRIISNAGDGAKTKNYHDSVESTIQDLQSSVSKVCEGAECGILLDPAFQDEKALDGINQGEIADLIDTDNFNLQKIILGCLEDSAELEISRETIIFKSSSRTSRFRLGYLNGHPIVVEYHSAHFPSSSQLQQLRKITAQVCSPKRRAFHILPGVGYPVESHHQRFGLVFEIPTEYSLEEPVMLLDVYQSSRGCLWMTTYFLLTSLLLPWTASIVLAGSIKS